MSEFEGLTLSAPSQTPGRRWSPLVPVLITVALVLGAAAVIWYLGPGGSDGPTEALPPRIVVLPFENLGPPEDEYFADGMTEEIISRLSAVSGLHVISRTSAMHYKKTDKTIRQIGEELRVQYALEGTIRWERAEEGTGRVRITPQLVKIEEDRHLWSDRYDRVIESVFEVQSDIAQQVVGQLNVSLLKTEEEVLNARPTDSPEAYEAFLRAQHHDQVNEYDQAQLAVMMYEQAVELDPKFAVAWALLAKNHSWIYFTGWDRTPKRLTVAKRAAERALELEPDLPEGHLALGLYYYWCHRDYERALAEFDRTLAARPNDTEAIAGRAYVLRRQGRWEESTSLLERVLEISPRDSGAVYTLNGSYRFTRDFRRAEEYADLCISLAPDRPDGYSAKLMALFAQGRLRDARAVLDELPISSPLMTVWGIRLEITERRFEAALEKLHEAPADLYEQVSGERAAGGRALNECACYFFLGDQQGVQEVCGRALVMLEAKTDEAPDNLWFHEALGQTYAYLGRREEAIREAERAAALAPVEKDALDGPIHLEALARIFALVGEPEASMDQIEYLLSIPSLLTVDHLRLHPFWDPLRDHPRFQALLEKYESED